MNRWHWSIIALVILAAPLGASANTALTTSVSISSDNAARARATTFTLSHGTRTWTAPAGEVRTWFSASDTSLKLRPGDIYDYLNIHISPVVNKPGVPSRFVREGGVIKLVGGGTKGSIVDGVKTSLAIRDALVSGKRSARVYMKEDRPSIFSAADFAKLSFPHKLAQGESSFAGSPRNRIHNIAVATARYNGAVIMPGEEFSFNKFLGTVDGTNGYLPELVIKEGVTTPEFGGGICQVSTTAFRAAMEAGLKVTSRRNHSYPVAYYGTPGYDATVYSPYTDLKFKNDTANPVLLKTSIVGTRVIFETWGTNDGRQVTVNGPFVTARKPDGSLTAAVAQIVKKNGKSIREQNFVSQYQPASKFPTITAANGE